MKGRAKAMAYSALAAALGTVLLLIASVLPSGRMVMVCVASLGVVFVECLFGWKWALGAYAVTALLSLLLLPTKAIPILYAAFFGYYPLILMLTERLGNKLLRYGIRLALFNLAMLLLYYTIGRLFSLDAGPLGAYPALLFLGMNACFLLYDRALAQGTLYFMRNIARRIK